MNKIETGSLFVPSEFFKDKFDKVLLNIQNSSLSGSEKKTLLALSELATPEGMCCASAPKIAELADINAKTANGATVSLARKGFLLAKRGKGVPNVYFFLWNDLYIKASKGPVFKKEDIELLPLKRQRPSVTRKPSKVNETAIMESLAEIKGHYHQDRRNQQPTTAKRELASILNEAVGKAMIGEGRNQAIEAKKTQIVDFINQMKTLPIWTRNGGKYLLGLGNFLIARGWEMNFAVDRSSLDAQVAELIENAQ